MRFNFKQLIGLPVITQSNNRLGKIAGVEFDSDTHSILNYQIVGLKLFGRREFLISPTQVVSIDDKKMVVFDASEKIFLKVRLGNKTATGNAPAVSTRE